MMIDEYLLTDDNWYHKFFECPTFWEAKPAFTCPKCGAKYRCYWDGNDTKMGIDLCDPCTKKLPEVLQ